MKTSENAPAQLRQHLHRGGLEREVGMAGQQRGDQVGVVGGLRRLPARRVGLCGRLADRRGQLGGVGQVAVVPERDPAAVRRRTGTTAGRSPRCRSRWWSSGCGRSRGGRAARRGSARRRPGRPGRGPCRRRRSLPSRDRDAGRLLAAVLQGVEAVVGELGDLLARRPDAEDAAGVLGRGFVGDCVVGAAGGTDWLLVVVDVGKRYVKSVARGPAAIRQRVVSTSSGRGTIRC